jgi:hypothetical protein
MSTGLSAPSVPPSPSGSRLGREIRRAWETYLASWKDWIGPSAMFFGIAFACILCCYVPFFLAYGPLSVGMHTCALNALRGIRVDTSGLARGQQLMGRAMGAGLMLLLLQGGPILLFVMAIVVVQVSAMALFAGAASGPGANDEAAAGAAAVGALVIFVSYVVGILALMAWSLWIGTRTMFVLPLVADHGVDFRSSLRMSWQATKSGFWELLAIHLLAGIVAGLGAYVLYVGIIFTIPLYYLLVGAAYESRFAPPSPTSAALRPGESPFLA